MSSSQDRRIEAALSDLDDVIDAMLESAAKLGEVHERLGKLFKEINPPMDERKAHDAAV